MFSLFFLWFTAKNPEDKTSAKELTNKPQWQNFCLPFSEELSYSFYDVKFI